MMDRDRETASASLEGGVHERWVCVWGGVEWGGESKQWERGRSVTRLREVKLARKSEGRGST